MKLWTIWQQTPEDGYTWIDDAWTDDQTAENPDGWAAAVAQAEENARANRGLWRVIVVDVPDKAILDAFKVPEVDGTVRPA